MDALYALKTGRQASLPLADIWPLLQDFASTYRGLVHLAMVHDFGWADKPPQPEACRHTAPAKLSHITLTAVPDISPATKARAVFLVRDAVPLAFGHFREAIDDKNHPLYAPENQELMKGYDNHVEQVRACQILLPRVNMVIMRLHFSIGVRGYMYFKSWFYVDDPKRDYLSQ